MILSGQTIRRLNIMSPCHPQQRHHTGMTYGLGPAGYDVTIRESLVLLPGRTVLASAVERFAMPNNVLGIVHDKSTLARRGLTVQNTVIEPGWYGYLTLELTWLPLQGSRDPHFAVVEGQPIAQVVFHLLDEPAEQPYSGRYQDQPPRPVEAI